MLSQHPKEGEGPDMTVSLFFFWFGGVFCCGLRDGEEEQEGMVVLCVFIPFPIKQSAMFY